MCQIRFRLCLTGPRKLDSIFKLVDTSVPDQTLDPEGTCTKKNTIAAFHIVGTAKMLTGHRLQKPFSCHNLGVF